MANHRNEWGRVQNPAQLFFRKAHKGFILLYVAAMLAAIAAILLQLGRMQSPSPLFMEKRLVHEIQRREGLLLLDFVLVGMQAQKLPVDPRFIQYKRILAASPHAPSEMDEQIEWLKSMLSQLNFKIDNKGTLATGGKGGESEQKSVVADELQEAMQERLFQPRKEPYKLKLGETEYSIRIFPANAMPNLNTIEFDALSRYLLTLKIPGSEAKELAAALIDWRDPDSFKTEGIGAETEYYSNLQQPYVPRNAPIGNWQELIYVRGMTPQRVRLFRDHFMLWPDGTTGISIEYATEETMVALTGLKPEIVKGILKEYGRLGEKGGDVGGILFSQDTTIFERAISWSGNPNLMRIQITSPENILTADYDARGNQIIAWW